MPGKISQKDLLFSNIDKPMKIIKINKYRHIVIFFNLYNSSLNDI